MQIVYSTEGVHPVHQLEAWRETIGRTLLPLEFWCPKKGEFRARAKSNALGPLKALQIETAAAHRASRGPRAARASSDDYLVSIVTRGEASIRQGDSEARLGLGDFTVYDSTHSFEVATSKDFSKFILQIPRAMLRSRLSSIEAVSCRVSSSRGHLNRIFTRFVTSLLESQENFPIHVTERLAEQSVDLLAMALMTNNTDSSRAGACWEATFYRVKSCIESRLHDPTLSPAAISAAAGISQRYLHKLFHHHGISAMNHVWSRRLERCRQDLINPAEADATIAQIAYRWGFNDPSHFSRMFKTRFNMSVREYRRLNGCSRSATGQTSLTGPDDAELRGST